MEYEEMLERAYQGLPEILKEESRFQVPELESAIQGRVTVIHNFGEVAKALNRSADMLSKYFLGEMGTSGEYDAARLILKGQFKASQLQDKLEAFVESYVMCHECKRPDTTIIQEKRVSFLKCEACGARHPITTIKQEAAPKEQKKELAVGDEIVVQITRTGKKGDGMARHGKFVIFVTNSREGQTVKARITGINKNMAFADILKVL
ncbi:MAG: translation initiation factor IF-2 subunit beta [Candidatus Hydrothermarchaeales archaeon]